MDILKELQRRVLICDGGMGSLLQAAGLAAGELPETWNLLHPEVVRGIHLDYLRAGADIVTANTFGANGIKYGGENQFSLSEIIRAGLACAREAVREAGRGYVALDMGPTGKLLQPMGELPFEDCVAAYAEAVREGVKGGADLILIETMSDLRELKAAVLAAKENSGLPVFATVTLDARGRLLTGARPETVAAVLEGLRVDALGLNCGLGPAQMKPFVERLLAVCSVPVMLNPNAGLPRVENGKTVYDVGPEEYSACMEEMVQMGVSIAGGCCGTTPRHIALLSERIGERPAPGRVPKTDSVVTSYTETLRIGSDPVLIGERINPTGKPKLKAALREKDYEYVLDMALRQEERGAQALDVNVGLPEIAEAEVLCEVVEKLQSVTDLPLQIDTADPDAMERALRLYNGKALINSVNGKQEIMDKVFPLQARYGGVVVALLLDEEGIPDTAEGRVRIARKILKEAEGYGISKKDILFDCVCLAVSADPAAGRTTLETIRRIREELGGNTVLGVSNISFGLPRREHVTSAFLAMALKEGLSAAIMNPNSEVELGVFRAYRVLGGFDENCLAYVEAYKDSQPLSAAGTGKGGASGVGAGTGKGRVSGTGAGVDKDAAAGTAVGAGAGEAAGKVAATGTAGTAGEGAAGKEDTSGHAGEPGKEGVSGRGTVAGEGVSFKGASVPGEDELKEQEAFLIQAVERGLKAQAAAGAAELLKAMQGTEIINRCMIPALDRVGRGFEKGKLFLPQLLMSAEAAKEAFGVIKASLSAASGTEEKKGRIILATVKGDIHDIGKNIVKVLLENYGYEVLDLGKDVPAERIVEVTLKEKIRLVGLSALMTTTVDSMEETIKQLKAASPETKIAVGGAVLTREYAENIGADAYCADAMATVNYAAEVFA